MSGGQGAALQDATQRAGLGSAILRVVDLRVRGSGWRLALITLVLVLLTAVLVGAIRGHVLGFDFRGTLWDPGQAILSGRSPYPAPHAAALRTGNPAVYPPAIMLLVSPLTLLPWAAGVTIWLLVSTF